MYVILEGSVKVHDKDHVYGVLGQRDCFGEYALIDNNGDRLQLPQLKELLFLFLEEVNFKLMASDSGFSQGILAVMSKRHRELDIVQEQLASSKMQLEIASLKNERIDSRGNGCHYYV